MSMCQWNRKIMIRKDRSQEKNERDEHSADTRWQNSTPNSPAQIEQHPPSRTLGHNHTKAQPTYSSHSQCPLPDNLKPP
jgi:hypothetical protein